MSTANGPEIEQTIERITWPDRIGAAVAVAASVGDLAVLGTGVVDPATGSGKAILAAGAAGVILGIPGLIKIDRVHRQNLGI